MVAKKNDVVNATFEGIMSGKYTITGKVYTNALNHLCIGANILSHATDVEILEEYYPSEPTVKYVLTANGAVFSNTGSGWRTSGVDWPISWKSLYRRYAPLRYVAEGDEIE